MKKFSLSLLILSSIANIHAVQYTIIQYGAHTGGGGGVPGVERLSLDLPETATFADIRQEISTRLEIPLDEILMTASAAGRDEPIDIEKPDRYDHYRVDGSNIPGYGNKRFMYTPKQQYIEYMVETLTEQRHRLLEQLQQTEDEIAQFQIHNHSTIKSAAKTH